MNKRRTVIAVLMSLAGCYLYWAFLLGAFRDDIDLEAEREAALQAEQRAAARPLHTPEEAEALLAEFGEVFRSYYDPEFPDRAESEFRTLCPQAEMWLFASEPQVRLHTCSVARSGGLTDGVVGYDVSVSAVVPSRQSAAELISAFEDLPFVVVRSVSVDKADTTTTDTEADPESNDETGGALPLGAVTGTAPGGDPENTDSDASDDIGAATGCATNILGSRTVARPLTAMASLSDIGSVTPSLFLGWGGSCPARVSLSLELYAAPDQAAL